MRVLTLWLHTAQFSHCTAQPQNAVHVLCIHFQLHVVANVLLHYTLAFDTLELRLSQSNEPALHHW